MKTLTKPLQPHSEQVRQANFKFRADGESTNGSLEGIANKIGAIDSYWTISHPRSRGFSTSGVETFSRCGSFMPQHDTEDAPIGFIASANVVGRDFNVVCNYHSDKESQRWRTIAQERFDAGKEVGLSIGFTVSRYLFFEDGEEVIKYLEDNQEDLSLFDVEGIRAHTDYCWLMWVDRVYEVSHVNFNSNEESVATSVRSAAGMSLGDVLKRMASKGIRMTDKELLDAARDCGVLVESDGEEFVPDATESEEDLEKADRAFQALEKLAN